MPRARQGKRVVWMSLFPGEKLLEGHAHLRPARAERRANLAFGEVLPGEAVDFRCQLDVANLANQRRSVEVGVDELLYFASLGRFLRDVDEERPRQRLVGAVANSLR